MNPETPKPEDSRESAGIQPDAVSGAEPSPALDSAPRLTPVPTSGDGPRWVFLGSSGLRSGWSVAIFFALLAGFGLAYFASGGILLHQVLHRELDAKGGLSPFATIFGEGLMVLALVSAAATTGLIERRRILDYNLRGVGRASRFVSGLVTGFLALSVLVGALSLGGWIHFGPAALSGAQIYKYATLWAFAFLLVGIFEEGACRCYLQFTLTRGVNFWWALGLVALMCLDLVIRTKGQGVWGVYAFALLGLAPCLWLYLRKAKGSGFWFAAWLTSTFFGFAHTGNGGENWIGIFAAAAVGFVFCVSVYATGSAWWAIGCHAAWDWAETFFYGTADSGNLPKGHLLTTTPTGSALWSGGSDGPEGSLLILPVVALICVAVLLLYRRRSVPPGNML